MGQMIARFEASQSISVSAGPLPPPEILQEYENVLKGAAKRLFELAEKQSAHRQQLESKVIGSEILRSYAGLAAGFIIALVCVIGGLIVINNGHETAGTTVATVPVASLAGIFVYGSLSRKKEREAKAMMMSGMKNLPSGPADRK